MSRDTQFVPEDFFASLRASNSGERVAEMRESWQHAPVSPITENVYPASVARYAFGQADEDILVRKDTMRFPRRGFHIIDVEGNDGQ